MSSKKKIVWIDVGTHHGQEYKSIFSNNYFWLHGRKAFKEHSGLSRELLRIRGTFFH